MLLVLWRDSHCAMRKHSEAAQKHHRNDSFSQQESSWIHSNSPQKHCKSTPWQQSESSHYDLKYTSVSKQAQTDLSLSCSNRGQLEALSLSKAFPRLLEAVSEQFSRWPKEKARLRQLNSTEIALEQLTHMLKTAIWKLASALDPYFIEHCNGVDQIQPWELIHDSKGGDFVHCIMHKTAEKVYALDLLQCRTEECPYGVRVCFLGRHAK